MTKIPSTKKYDFEVGKFLSVKMLKINQDVLVNLLNLLNKIFIKTIITFL